MNSPTLSTAERPRTERLLHERAPQHQRRLTCSIIVPVCRGGPKFRECFSSLLAAARPEDEIIVVADGDGDRSWEIAETAGARVVKLPLSSGPACARNAGARAARNDIIFFVDADVTVPPNAVECVRKAFEEESDLDAAIGSYDEQPAELNFHSQYKNLFHHFVHQKGSTKAFTFWGACGAIRREVFLESGGFNETYERPCIEDIELGYRLTAAAKKIRLLPNLQVKHLKRWDAQSLVATDLFDRATPWTELILDYFLRRKGRVSGDLNLGMSYRLSLLVSLMLIAATVGVFFTRWALPLMVLCGTAFVLLNLPFLKFFSSKRGRGFALHALAWRFGYDIYSGVGLCYGSVRYVNASTRRVLSDAFARLDPIGLGAAGGAVIGGYVFLATVILLLKDGPLVGPRLSLLSEFFYGYTVTWVGSGIGLLYGAAVGFVLGFSFAFFRNTAMKLHLGSRRVQRFFQRVYQTQGVT